ncbi:MAG: malate synthase A [Cytophagales bacterium]|nr:malate synthase A [Bernardetiaceae bacterium]MDW8205248.1 malate synthase A [Cytophagales bacterium]
MEATTAHTAIQLLAPVTPQQEEILSPAALEFLHYLHQHFNARRKALLAHRQQQQQAFNRGELPDFLPETEHIRQSDWQVLPIPADLQDRRVEITGPVDRKMIINALNSGAKVFMADFEDANSPTWENCLEGQINLRDAIRRTIDFRSPEGKLYELNEKTAVLKVRPRGWHLPEKHLLIQGEPASASLFDFGLFIFHNAHELLAQGSAPYFYLPKLENHREARLWNDVFTAAENYLRIPRGCIKATVLIETITAAFEMDEIIYELREHMAGLNAGRWDYIFSFIKKFNQQPDFILPDRADVTMTVPFMKAYAELLVATCHKRGAHAIGGMSAFIPGKDPAINARAFANVQADKEREAQQGYDGTWVAHPGLVPIAQAVFDRFLGEQPHQKQRLHQQVAVSAEQLLNTKATPGQITLQGIKTNIRVGILYTAYWLKGQGAVAIDNLMEDAATAEISRAQLWQWLHHRVTTAEGILFEEAIYRSLRAQILEQLSNDYPTTFTDKLTAAAELLDHLVLSQTFEDFLTIKAYQMIT